MGFFDFGRSEGFPSRYSTNETPVTIDYTETISVIIFVIVIVSYLAVVPGHRRRRSICVAVEVALSATVGCLIIVENFGQEWEVGTVKSVTPYRAGDAREIDSTIGVKVALRSVNITLRADGEGEDGPAKEIINYNERFSWTWDQGRFGFGPYAGLLQRSFRESQRRGLPLPILWVAEYFTIDGEGIRFGRFYRTAGWYCHILLWTAFACWILTNVFLQSVGRYAAYFAALAGGLQILACIVWVTVRNPNVLVIPFQDGTIQMTIGRHFFMTLACGSICLILASILIFMDLRYPNDLSIFLGVDPLNQYDECLIRVNELETITRRKKEHGDTFEMIAAPENQVPTVNNGMVVLKRRSTMINVQKDLFRTPLPVQIDHSQDAPDYENPIVIQSSSTDKQRLIAMKRESRPPVPKRAKKPVRR